ncbi:MAG: hypothetical protein ABS75_01520 [Pelagibacterium sp. SCN 63-23]|nr:MAG: hypothetical protein ABS75_01520 [Pelagibacterium sp. SCN 63-23]
MLTPEDRRAIEDLFERLANVERNSAPRDREAERLIWERMRDNPASAYFMAQTIIVQEAALREQQKRIAELEQGTQGGEPGFLDSIFGRDRPEPQPQRRPGPWERQGGGGFLAGAAQTALGVTGGMLLGSAIGGLFSTPATAGESSDQNAQDAGGDDGMDGGDDWGGFDIGGEF